MKRFVVAAILTLANVLQCPIGASAATGSPKNPIQFKIEMLSKPRSAYAPGDTLQFRILAIQNDLSCSDGVEKTRVFMKGLRMQKQSSWKETTSGKWQKELTTLVGTNPAKGIQLTAYRETDAGKSVETFTIKP